MEVLLQVVAAWAIAFVINLFPAFMPPTWSVLAVFHVVFGAPLLPLTIGGAAMSAVGRIGLALGSRQLERFMPKSDVENARALGSFVNRHRAWREAIYFGYCLGPFPSNALFIAAGVGRIPLLPVTIAFFLSRCIADTAFVWLSGSLSSNLGDVFVKQMTSWQAIVIQVLALGAVVVLFRLPWARWVGIAEETDEATGEKPAKTPRRPAVSRS